MRQHTHMRTHAHTHRVMTDNYLLPFCQVSPPTTERKRGKEKETALYHYVCRENYLYSQFCLYTQTNAHALRISINMTEITIHQSANKSGLSSAMV